MGKKVVFSFIAIAIVLAVAFFSQQAYSKNIFKNILSMLEKNAGASLLNGFNFNSAKTNSPNSSSSNVTNSSATNKKTVNSASGTANVDAYATQASASQKLIDKTPAQISPMDYITKGLAAVSSAPQTVVGDIKNGGEIITNGIKNTTENISGAEKNISNYFSGVANSIVHPGTAQNCPVQNN